VIRLVPDIPGKHAAVFSKGAHNALHIALQPRILCGVCQRLRTGALHPLRVMNAWRRFGLRAEMRIWVPAGIEEDKDRPDLVSVAEIQECVNPLLESFRVLFPK